MILVIWSVSVCSIILMIKLNRGKKLVVLALNSLAVGTLMSDALLHIIPSVTIQNLREFYIVSIEIIIEFF